MLLILAVSFQAGNAMRVSGGLSLPEILFLVVLTAAFLLHPRRPDAAMAVIASATLAEERVVVADLESLPARVEAAGLRAPALAVVGAIVGMRAELLALARAEMGA